ADRDDPRVGQAGGGDAARAPLRPAVRGTGGTEPNGDRTGGSPVQPGGGAGEGAGRLSGSAVRRTRAPGGRCAVRVPLGGENETRWCEGESGRRTGRVEGNGRRPPDVGRARGRGG